MKRERHSVHPLYSIQLNQHCIEAHQNHCVASERMVLALAIHTVSTQVSAKARHSLQKLDTILPERCYETSTMHPTD